jgi:hypothetical protein
MLVGFILCCWDLGVSDTSGSGVRLEASSK